ncbi:MAG: hypothetical protein IH897_14750 [Planctomycetes bacterium]|nr:hypothetical protein [Planctomycetota bacterium]
MAYLKRLAVVALALGALLTVASTLAYCAFVPVTVPPDVWRDGACIYKCEPLGGVALDHMTWQREDGRWLCSCSDGHVYLLP